MENTLSGVAGKKFILSYSCGKDSTLCLHKMLEAGAEPMALLVMFNPEAGRSYFHGVDPALLKEYGEALELPLLAVPTGGEEYHLSMEAALRRAKEQGVELVCFGDIDIENNRAWGEERCRNVGLEAVYPLWHHDRQENVREVSAMARIILASGSPRRQELLRRIGLREFEISVPDVEEWYPPELAPEDIVAYISREKSQAVQAAADAIVITADTMVFLDDQRLGKPHDEAEALSMLTALSGRKHKVCTGVTVRQGEKALTRAQSTDVYFREVSRQELLAYIRGGEPMDKAGAYGVQGQGALLVERIDGDFFNVMGLPVVLLSRMLAEFGVTLLA